VELEVEADVARRVVARDHLRHAPVDRLERSMSAKWARGRARAASSGSRSARSVANSSIRSLVSAGVAMRPEAESWSAPSAASLRTASRAGVMETPKALAMPRRVSASPGATSPCTMRARSVR
jgi:hypothetical protein